MFCSFASETDRDEALEKLKSAALSHHGENIWANASSPLNIRVPRSFLLGMRYLLIKWGFDKTLIRVDDVNMILFIDHVEHASACVVDNRLSVKWSISWESWSELYADADVKKLLKTAQTKLARGGTGSKGRGKSKSD